MSVNRHRPHLLVLPEDDANRVLANGFLLAPTLRQRHVQVLPPAGGWPKVLDACLTLHVANLRRFAGFHLVLLIDFDDQVQDRTQHFTRQFPADVSDRVYLIGTGCEPERHMLKSRFESFGLELGMACADADFSPWNHDFLAHNSAVVQRLAANVRPFLFPTAAAV